VSALGPHAEKAQQVYDVAMGQRGEARKLLQKLGERDGYSRAYSKASNRAVKAAREAGRYEPAFGYDGRWADEICGTFACASDVQCAVLVRDLISEEDYRLILGWWVEGGLADPHGVVTR
jgi:hypothetical protein